jgi:hypothetical protein
LESKSEPVTHTQLHLISPAEPVTIPSILCFSDEHSVRSQKAHAAPRPQELSERFGGFEPYVDEFVVASFLGLEPRRVLELAREGHITSHPLGQTRKTWRFRISEIAVDMDRMKKPARAKMPAAVPGTKERNRLG